MRAIFGLTAFVAFLLPAWGTPVPPRNPVIAGYVFPDGTALEPEQIHAQALTRINYAFANIKDGRVVEGSPQDAANLARLGELRRENPALTLLISVGGWSWSTHFSDAALTKESREIFVASAMEFIERYHLDGLDVDWEYPGQRGAGNTYRKADKQNFTLLLKELRERFDRETRRTHKRLYLTIAAEASDEYLEKTEMDKVQRYVDDVNLMAYDFYVPGPDHTTGNIAPLFVSPGDPKDASANKSVLAFEAAGVPATKIVLGVPFYGRAWRDVADRNHGRFQRGKAGADAYLSYARIAQTMLEHGFTRYWDSSASVPYLYSAEQHIFVSYEDPESLAAKCRYVEEHKLAGVMFWNYADDPSGKLLGTVDRTLRGPAEEPGEDIKHSR